MSGHSKWATTKRRKEAVDAKRGVKFTALGRAVTVAAKEGGGDLDTNFKLRLAVEKAKGANMPKDNIERAIKRGTGELAGDIIEEIIYEGFGPGGVAVVVMTLTDNRNRTAADIKHAFSKHGGNLGGPNSVLWQFEQKGIIALQKPEGDIDELALIDAGADDFEVTSDGVMVVVAGDALNNVVQKLTTAGFTVSESKLDFLPTQTTEVNEAEQAKLERFIDALDSLDDVSSIVTNAS